MTIAVRRHFKYLVKDEFGNAISNAQVFIYLPGTTTVFTGTAYTTLSGGTTTTNPFTTNTQGEIEAWFDTPQAVDILITDNSDLAVRAGYSGTISFSSFTEFGLIGTGIEATAGNLAVIDAGDTASAGTSVFAAAADHQHTYTTVPNAHGSAQHTDIARTLFLPVLDVVNDGGTVATRGTAPDALRVITLADAASTGCIWARAVPGDWASGAITCSIYHAGQTTTTGTVRWTIDAISVAAASSVVAAGTSASFTGASVTTADLLVKEAAQTTVTPAAAGDLFRISVRRIGGDGADTYAASTSLIGILLSYTAVQ